MVKRTVRYTDYNGELRVEDIYFNLNEAELAELEWSENGGLSAYMQQIKDAQDVPKMSEIFKKVLTISYGVKSADGKFFRKGANHEYAIDFFESGAYPTFFMDLIKTKGALAKFFNELVPPSLLKEAEEARVAVEKEETERLNSAIGSPTESPISVVK